MIRNLTKGTVVAKRHKICRSYLSKMRGLMFRRKTDDMGYVFMFSHDTRVSLHMLFVFFAIDVIFLDSASRIIEIKERFLPFCPVYMPKHKARTVIEVPHGYVKASMTKVGDILTIG